VHVLVIPKKHISSLVDLKEEDERVIGKIYTVINKIAEAEGILEKGFRVIVNCGEDGGQEVKHLHFHLLGGKKLGAKIA
jgi:histidine triad (HIT) family protein